VARWLAGIRSIAAGQPMDPRRGLIDRRLLTGLFEGE
jgi:hypothetical protein